MNNETDREWPDPKPRYSDHLPSPSPFGLRVIGGSSIGAGLLIAITALWYSDPVGQVFGLALLFVGGVIANLSPPDQEVER